MSKQPSYEKLKNRLSGLQGPTPLVRSSSHLGWILRLLLVAISLVLLWIYFAPNRAEYAKHKREEAERAAQKAAQQKSISELAKRYNAITDWRNHLRDRTATDPIYSAELTPALINPARRPVLFIGSIRDVGQVDGKYSVSLEGLINFQTDFLLHISSSDEQAKRIMAEPRGDNRLAVVAVISLVDSGRRKDEDEPSSGRADINIEGELLEFEYLGPYRGDLHEVLSTFRRP